MHVKILRSESLVRVLILPFVTLVTVLALTLGWLSFRAGESAADDLSRRVVLDMMARIRLAADEQVSRSETVLRVVAPEGDPASGSSASIVQFPNGLDALEERLWIATGIYPGYQYVYFAAPDSGFIGVRRRNDGVELRLREPGDAYRRVYRVQAPGDRSTIVDKQDYDGRTRPWYHAALAHKGQVWSPVYTDFSTKHPTVTLSKPVYRPDGALAGVAATDLLLGELTTFFSKLEISANGVAFIVERNGNVIATSSPEPPYRVRDKTMLRLTAAESVSLLAREAYAEIRLRIEQPGNIEGVIARRFNGTSGPVQIAFSSMAGAPGLDWIAVVAVPQSDFMNIARRSLLQNMGIGVAAVIITLLLGLIVLNRVLRDIRKLAGAAHRIGIGETVEALDVDRKDELGHLAKSFVDLQRSLHTDQLTGVMNRDSLLAYIARRQLAATTASPLEFGLLFIDLDRFKTINDVYGHEAGDWVLIEVAKRLKQSLRSKDQVARFGGDEFVVYIDAVSSPAYLTPLSDKLQAEILRPIALPGGCTDAVGASIGAAHYPSDATGIEELYRIADARMFSVKNANGAVRSR